MSLGKIRSIRIGMGGCQDAMFGVTYDLETKDGSVTDFDGFWESRPDSAKWSLEQQREHIGQAFLNLNDTMKQAKVNDAQGLIGKPVDVTFNDNALVTWRILSEVL